MDYILHGFGKKLQQDGQILEGFFQFDLLFKKEDISTYNHETDVIAMTLKWDDYLTVLDEDDLDEAEEQRITKRLEYALKQRKDHLKGDLELLITNEQEDNQNL